MKDIIIGLLKWIYWILIILILGLAILAFRIFVIDKDYDGTAESLKKKKNNNGASSNSVTNTVVSSGSSENKTEKNVGSLGQSIVNGVKTIGNSTVKGYKEDQESYTYNEYNFDEYFLMYEGERYAGDVRNVLEHLVDNSNGTFYARTSVESRNFGNNVIIDYNGDLGEYQNSIINLESTVSEGMYEISFEYGFLNTYVNKIVITKK